MAASDTIALFGIGSSNLRSTVGTPDGIVSDNVRIDRTDPRNLVDQVHERLEDLREREGGLDAASIACGGPIDDGVVREMTGPDGTTVTDVPLAAAIEDEFDIPVRLENDCTAAALAEWTFGAGREHDCDCVVHLTMGTGIGAGVVDRGRVVRGADGHAAEVGLLPIGPPERESCGVPGAWEAYCSGRGIAEYVGDLLRRESRDTVLPGPDDVTARDVFEAAADGDAVAQAYLERIGRYNAAGLGAVINAYNPDLLTIGGGVGGSNFETILEGARPHLDRFAIPEIPRIEPTQLGDRIGLYGALAPFVTETRATPTAETDD